MGTSYLLETFVILTMFLFFVGTVNGIRCYQCISTNNSHPFQCNEALTDDIDMEPEPCENVFGAQYCVKHTGRFEGGIGTKRYCSALHMGNYCDYVKQQGDKLTYRTCIFTCDTDGCNHAASLQLNRNILGLSVGLLLAGLFRR